MIKKSFITLIKHPLIILAFMYNVLLQVYEYVSANSIDRLSAQGASYAEMIGTVYRNIAILAVVSLLYIFLLLPTLNNLVYEICTGKKTKGWLKRRFKRCTGRFAGYNIMTILLVAAYIVLLQSSWIAALLLLPFLLFNYPLQSGLSAEDNFENGMTKGIRYGRKYYFKMLGIFGIALLTFMIIFAVDYLPDFKISLTGDIITSVSQAFFVAFMTIYSMYCYLQVKDKMEEDTDETDDEEHI